jgi:hypothetical protein
LLLAKTVASGGVIVTTISGQTIKGEDLQIDDTAYVGCTLINCVLNYQGGAVVLDSTVLRNCKYVFYGPARRTVELLQQVGIMPFVEEEWCEFRPRYEN